MKTKIVCSLILLVGLHMSALSQRRPGPPPGRGPHPEVEHRHHHRHAPVRSTDVYLRGGLNLSNAVKMRPDVYDKDFKPGFNVGIQVDNRLDRNLYFQSGMFFTTKGVEIFNAAREEESTTINQMYLQLPLALAYKIPMERRTRLVFNFGGYLAYGVGGKTDDGAVRSNTFGKKNLKRFDAGISGGIGLEIGNLLLGVNYERGLVDIAHAKKDSYYNQNVNISLGIRL